MYLTATRPRRRQSQPRGSRGNHLYLVKAKGQGGGNRLPSPGETVWVTPYPSYPLKVTRVSPGETELFYARADWWRAGDRDLFHLSELCAKK